MINTSPEKTKVGFTIIIASAVFFVIIALLWTLLTFFPSFTGGVTAKKSALADIGNTIVVFSFISLALQSSLGVFINNFRSEEKNRKNRHVNKLMQETDEIKDLIDPTIIVSIKPEQLAEKERKLKDLKNQLEEAEDDLQKYKDTTKAIVTRLSLIAGIVISLGGIRILQTFTDISLVGKQLSLFNAIDILLTGGLLAGGTAGVNRLTQVYEDVTDVTKKVSQ